MAEREENKAMLDEGIGEPSEGEVTVEVAVLLLLMLLLSLQVMFLFLIQISTPLLRGVVTGVVFP